MALTCGFAPAGAMTIGEAKLLPDLTDVQLDGKVITGIFPDEACIYIEEPDQTSGIRIAISGVQATVGDIVNVSGKITGHSASERRIAWATLTPVFLNFPVGALAMNCKSVGGGPGSYVFGVNGGVGLGNIGSLVTIAGRVTSKSGSSIYVDDGSEVPDTVGRIGVVVKCLGNDTPIVLENRVSATGVVMSNIPSGWTSSRRYMRIRTGDDLILLSPDPLSTTGAISGVVKDDLGDPLTGATISTGTGGFSATSVTGGLYTISGVTPGTYSVTASKTGYDSLTQTGTSVAAARAERVNFTLPLRLGTISGTVKNSGNSHISGAVVSTDIGGYSTTTGSDGGYTLSNVDAGTYDVAASMGGYASQIQSDIVVVGRQTSTVNFVLVTSIGTITGTVKGPSSTLLAGATVTTNTGGYTATTGTNGVYTMLNVNAGTYSVTASCGGYLTVTSTGVSVTAGNTTTKNFTLSRDVGIVAGPPKLGTHLFYWHDAPSGNVNQSQMPYHPPGMTSPYNGTYYSSLSQAWYEWQLADMKLAGIDYAFPVSWGEKYQSAYFKQSVLSRLVSAIRNTQSNVKIGLYDDTSSEAAEWNADCGRGYTNSQTDQSLMLSCAASNAAYYFYDEKIKPFFQMVPRDLWATHNGRPVSNGGRPLILTFVSYYYKDLGSANQLWQTIKTRFYNDFGVVPWLTLCWSWWNTNSYIGTVADGECVYGAATSGTYSYTTPNSYRVSNLGPGSDTTLLPGRTDYRARWADGDGSNDNLDDQWLRDNFRKAPSNVNLVVLESWNELWEGTAISRCVDFPHKTGGAYLSPTYYMDKTNTLMRELRDRTTSPSSLQNGTMESTFATGLAPNWTPFWVYGDITLADDTTVKHAGLHSQKLVTTGCTHLAGTYQRVTATSGTSYTFRAWTRRHDDRNDGGTNEETWVGIDPTGGVDPTSSSVVWSSSASSYETWTQQSATATASSTRITLFVRARANYAGTGMQANFDDATLSSP